MQKNYEYFRLSIVSSYIQLNIYIFGGTVVAHGTRTNYFDHIWPNVYHVPW